MTETLKTQACIFVVQAVYNQNVEYNSIYHNTKFGRNLFINVPMHANNKGVDEVNKTAVNSPSFIKFHLRTVIRCSV